MPPPTPDDRQTAIDIFTQQLVDGGMDDTDATDFATQVVDEAIRRKVY